MKKTDVIVIGGGILGTCHALHLARSGQQVVLFEKDLRPRQATVRNFGQVVPSGLAGPWFAYGRRGLEFLKSLPPQLSVRQEGSLYVAADADEQQLLHEAAALFTEKDYENHLLSPAQVLAACPVLQPTYVREGLFFPQEVSLEPHLYIHALHAYLLATLPTLRIRTGQAAVAVEPAGTGFVVRLASGERCQAGRVVLCGGSEFQLLFPEIFRHSGIRVSKLQMMRTVAMPDLPLPGNLLTGLTIRRYESFQACPSYATLTTPPHLEPLRQRGIHLLFKKALDGTVIIGDSHEYADSPDALGFQTSQALNALMLAEARRIVRFPVDELLETWIGCYAQHDEHAIFAHDPAPGLHIRTAIGGKGMTAAYGYAEAQVAGWL